MLATISGVTHKEILDKDFVDDFLEKEAKLFHSISKNRHALYDDKVMVEDTSLNYLNVLPECTASESLKNIILREYYHCDKIYPHLGDYLLFKFYNCDVVKGQEFLFNKSRKKKFIDSISKQQNKDIASWLFENTSLERSVNILSYPGSEIAIECLDEFLFDIQYDHSLIRNLPREAKRYKYVIINGYIESVGEIHHLLHEANITRVPYVIFCFGISNEVRETIMKNNAMGRLLVYPISLNANDENSLNVLNDFAAIHDGHVISSDLGESISQAVRKDLRIGNKITFSQKGLLIEPVADKEKIKTHRNFLKKRIEEAMLKPDVNIDPIKNRLKMFTGKRINIFIPENLLNDKKFSRELDYVLRFMSNINKMMRVFCLDRQLFYIPEDFINIANRKVKSLSQNMSNIQKIIL